MTPAQVRLRSCVAVTVHRSGALVLAPPHVVTRAGVPVTRLEAALVDSWPMIPADQRRALVIEAVGQRLTTPDRVRAALAQAPKLVGAAHLAALLDRLAAGCRSALEVWGHDRVFVGPGMPRFARQFPVRLGGRTIYLDVYAEAERVDFELDGAAWHGSPGQRERDLRRDAALAQMGILVVRFTHRRLVYEPDQVRHEVLTILAARRTLLGLSRV